jgi:CRP-like cAMP-binding protein
VCCCLDFEELKRLKLTYEQDLFPGEYFGEVALEGLHHRGATVQALTDVDLLVIDYEQYISARGHNHGQHQIRTQDKEKFLKSLPLFKGADNYTVSRFAHALAYDEVRKGNKIMSRNEAADDLIFILTGSVDLLRKLPGNLPIGAAVPVGMYMKQSVVATLQPGDYLCESGMINLRNEALHCSDRVTECCDAVASTRLGILTISASDALTMLPKQTVIQMCVAFTAKTNWRNERKHECRILETEKRKKKTSHNLDFLFEEPPPDHVPAVEEMEISSKQEGSPSNANIRRRNEPEPTAPNPYAVKGFDGAHLGVTPAAARDNGTSLHLSAAPAQPSLSDLTQARYSLLYMKKHIALPAISSPASSSSFASFTSIQLASPGKLSIDTSLSKPSGCESSSAVSMPSRVPSNLALGGGAPGEMPSVRPSKSRKSRRKKGVDLEEAKSNLRGLHAGLHKLKPVRANEFGPEIVEAGLPSNSMYTSAPFSVSKPLGSIPTDSEMSSEYGGLASPNAGAVSYSMNSLSSAGGMLRAIPVGNKSLGALLQPQTKLSPIPYDDNLSESGGVSSPAALPQLKDIPALINPVQVLSSFSTHKEGGRTIGAYSLAKSQRR